MPTPSHIFLVDDDADDRFLFQEAMREIAPQIRLSLADGCDMLTELSKVESHPDMILLDLNMPGLNGFECLDEIKKHPYASIPVLIYSTSAHPDQVKKTYTKGATLYMQKPSSFEGIKKLMNKLLETDLKDHIKAAENNLVLSA